VLETLVLFERCNLESVEIKLVCLWEVWLFVIFHWYTFSRATVFWGKLGAVNGSTCCNEDMRRSVFLDVIFLLPHASSCPVSTSKENPYSYKLVVETVVSSLFYSRVRNKKNAVYLDPTIVSPEVSIEPGRTSTVSFIKPTFFQVYHPLIVP